MGKNEKRIFWLDEDKESFSEIVDELKNKYYIEIGAEKELVERKRTTPFNLLIVDLMIRHKTGDKENIGFPNVSWQETGIEFVRRVRDDEFNDCGFRKAIPVIVITARSRKEMEFKHLKICEYLEKPFLIDDLEYIIKGALNESLEIIDG